MHCKADYGGGYAKCFADIRHDIWVIIRLSALAVQQYLFAKPAGARDAAALGILRVTTCFEIEYL
jgi:hypothetical protein